MLAALALVAVQSAAAAASPLVPVPKELSSAFARVLGRAPEFAGAPGRVLEPEMNAPMDDGLRAYCADSSGAVCATAEGQPMPPLTGATCPKACPPW